MGWGDALLTATYLINCVPSRILNSITPIQSFKKLFPSSRTTLDIPGSVVFAHNHDSSLSRLDPHVHKCIFVGYPQSQKGYKCFEPLSKNILCRWMIPSLKVPHITQIPIFREASSSRREIGNITHSSDFTIAFDISSQH